MRSTASGLLLVTGLFVAGVALAQSTQSVGDIVNAFQRGEIKLGDITARYAELAKTRAARRKAGIAELERTLGAQVFARKDVRGELARHHRIIALLERARLVAETELEGFRRASNIARIERIRFNENTRHGEAMARLTGAQPSPP
jgi:antitoxin (DNA-binding transcriptional repressor) of toxin-antitoxin stability system